MTPTTPAAGNTSPAATADVATPALAATAAADVASPALRDFTRKWLPRFRDSRQNLHRLLDTGELRADCAELGYVDDAGEAFDAAYPGAFDSLEELDWHLPAVGDTSLLGSAIMSKWNQVSHLVSHHFWATDETRCKAAGHEVRLWFILALERLAQLAGENSSTPPTRQPTALYLTSSTHDHGRRPSRSPLAHQRLELHENGDCRLVNHYLDEFGRSCISSDSYISISKDEAARLLDEASEWMTQHCCNVYETNHGAWTLVIEDEDGRSHYAFGALELLDNRLIHLSNSLRRALQRPDLLACSL